MNYNKLSEVIDLVPQAGLGVCKEDIVEKEIKTIGVLTSGGDAPGMNAAIRAVVRTALAKGIQVKGIKKGYQGLLNEEIIDMAPRSVSDIIQRGGTILGTARCMEFMTLEGQQQGADVGAVHVGIRHDDDLAIAQLGHVKVLADTAAQRRHHGN